VRKADNLTTDPAPLSCNLGTLTSWNPLGQSRPVMGLLYLYLLEFWKIRATLLEAICILYDVKKFGKYSELCAIKSSAAIPD